MAKLKIRNPKSETNSKSEKEKKETKEKRKPEILF
jgi:hypothetical protein